MTDGLRRVRCHKQSPSIYGIYYVCALHCLTYKLNEELEELRSSISATSSRYHCDTQHHLDADRIESMEHEIPLFFSTE